VRAFRLKIFESPSPPENSFVVRVFKMKSPENDFPEVG
jgi:hypothetical protein